MSIKSRSNQFKQVDTANDDLGPFGADSTFNGHTAAQAPVPSFAPAPTSVAAPVFVAPPAPVVTVGFCVFSAVSATSTTPTSGASTSTATTSTSTATTTKTSTAAPPSWVSSLSTSSIASDMAAADVNGT